MGKKGDQKLDYSQNKTLSESNTNGVDVFLFEVFERNKYIYRGPVKLVDKPFEEKQVDEDGVLRKVWIFPLKCVNNYDAIIEKEIIYTNYSIKEDKARKLSDSELEEKARESQSSNTGSRITISKTYERNPYVTELAKRKAKGVCQLCNNEAPFKNKNGQPYLETHHIEWLSNGGSDTIENTVALCPNCHRKMHIVNDENDIEFLKFKVKKLVNEMDKVL